MIEDIQPALPIVSRLQRSDIESYLTMFSESVMTILKVPSLQAERDYLMIHLAQQDLGLTHFYAIRLSQTNLLIGAIEIRDPLAYRGQLYCWMNERYWGSGSFTHAMQLAAADYFSQTTYTYFNAHVERHNKRSYYALKKCGFIDSGYLVMSDGDSYELMLCSATNHEQLQKGLA
jgi:RimJ/RimL family protein N-acetyltransferase